MRIRVVNMVAVIISILLVLIGVIILISAWINGDDLVFGVGFIIVAFWLSFCSLLCGRSIYKQDNTDLLMEKQTIEYVLENNPDYYIFEEAQKYNKKVNSFNNYFCRFNIEDRSEFEINIGKYLVNKK